MPNNYFQFKQFTVQQEHCAMKVCTDACLFGAWVAEKVKNENSKFKNVIDIGTGTGLLSLMLAQKTDVIIDAVEIDADAAIQAQQNFEASPWRERLKVYDTSIQQYTQSTHQLYNFIISNPPFFENDLRSDDDKRNLALHSKALGLEELFRIAVTMMAKEGMFAVVLPYHRTVAAERIAAANNMYLIEKVFVRQTPAHSFFRSMLLFSKLPVFCSEVEIHIKTPHQYSDAFVALLKDYYLYL